MCGGYDSEALTAAPHCHTGILLDKIRKLRCCLLTRCRGGMPLYQTKIGLTMVLCSGSTMAREGLRAAARDARQIPLLRLIRSCVEDCDR